MRVRVLYFGVLKDLLGEADETVELPNGAEVGELLSVLRARPSNEKMNKQVWQSLAVAVNREYARAEVVLCEGDEVALLPPVSGGCYANGESACFARKKPEQTSERNRCRIQAGVCHAG